jgi:hypothetical protein
VTYVWSVLFPYAQRLQVALRVYESDCKPHNVMSAVKGTCPERAGTSDRIKWNWLQTLQSHYVSYTSRPRSNRRSSVYLFNDAVSNLESITGWQWIINWKGCVTMRSWPILTLLAQWLLRIYATCFNIKISVFCTIDCIFVFRMVLCFSKQR